MTLPDKPTSKNQKYYLDTNNIWNSKPHVLIDVGFSKLDTSYNGINDSLGG